MFYRTLFCAACAFLLIATAGTPVSAASPLSGLNPAAIDPEAVCTSVYATTFWADNAITLEAIFLDEWGKSFTPSGVNNADAYWYAAAGFQYKGWRVAGFDRGELFLKANRDAVEILYMIKSEQDLPVGTRFEADVKADGFNAQGIELSRKVGLDAIIHGLSAGFTMRGLNAVRIQQGTLSGSFIPTGPKSYDFNLTVDYVYDDNLLYDRDNSSPESGNGYSFDIGTVYRWQDRIEASLLVRDILGKIRWNNAPYTTADATSDVKYFNSEGYQSFRPTIRGYEGYKDYTQKIPLKADVDVAYRWEPVSVCATLNFIDYRTLYWLAMDYALSERLTLSAGYNVNYGAYALGIDYGKLQLKAYSNSFSSERIKALGLTLSCCMTW